LYLNVRGFRVGFRDPVLAATAGTATFVPSAIKRPHRTTRRPPASAPFLIGCLSVPCRALRRYNLQCYPIVMQTNARQPLAIHKGQALALCWLLQQPVGAGGEILAGLTRTLAFSRPLSGTEWSAVPPVDRERETRAFHQRVLRLFRTGIAIRCPVVAKVSPTARGLTVERFRDMKAKDQGLLQLLEVRGNRLRRCRHCRAWFWRERKREYCGPCFQSGSARSKVHRANAKAKALRNPVSV
jgi:hypothetical protein